MRYRFGRFDIDTDRFTLREDGAEVHVERLVLDTLIYLVEHAGQVITREALIADVWKRRIVSDETIASCIKAARKALGDTGERQEYIRTVRGRGVQFVPNVDTVTTSVDAVAPSIIPEVRMPSPAPGLHTPPKIAVLPFHSPAKAHEAEILGDALAQEIILELSRLHWLFVIARGSSFKFRGQDFDFHHVGSTLGADYLVTGTIIVLDRQCAINVELCKWPEARVVWADRFTSGVDDLIHMKTSLAATIVAALEPRIQLDESVHAVATEDLSAWTAYHKGLRLMYRFTKKDNELAAHFFERAAVLDPAFARAHAALSFTHFQNAFLGLSGDHDGERRMTRSLAEKSIELDPLDPLANLTMGRAEWLDGHLDASLPWMKRAIELNPNYAFAMYNTALIGTMMGEGDRSEDLLGRAMMLSPVDPMNYAMLATRGLTYSVRGRHAEAAEWARTALQYPNAHVQIYTIAAFTHEIIGKRDDADGFVRDIRRTQPGYTAGDFLKGFPFRNEQFRREIGDSLRRLGL